MKSDFKFSNLLGTVYRQGNVQFSHDGNMLLSPVGNRISVFDLVNNKSFTFAYEHRKNIATFDVNKQGTLLLSVDTDGRAILVNFKTRNVLHHFNFKDKCYSVKFSPDGRYFALAVGRFLQIWKTPDVSQDRQFAPFVRYRVHAGHFQDITSFTWSHDSRFLLTTSKDLTSRVWSINSEDKELVATTLAGHRDYVLGAYFNSTQEKIYTISKDGAVFTWEYISKAQKEGLDEEDLEDEDLSKLSWRITKKNFFYANQAKVKCCTFHINSNLLIVGFSNGEFRLYEMPEFVMVQQLSMGQNPVNTVSVNNSGEWLAFGSSKLGQLLVYEWQSESYILKQQGHFDATNSLTYSPDGSRVVTAAEDGKIKVWDVASGFCLATFEEHTSAVTAVQFAKKGQVLFSASLDGTVRAWDLIRYRNFRVFTATERVQFTCLAVEPSGEVVSAGSTDSFDVFVWSVQTGQLLDTLSGHEGPVSCLAFSMENAVLASASWDKTIRIWSIFGRSQQVEPLEVFADILAITITPDGKHVAVSTLKGQLTIFDIASGKQIGNIDCRKDIISGRFLQDRFTSKNSERSKYFTTINYSFDGKSIIAGGNNNSICLYDVPNEVLLKRFIVSRNMNLNGTLEFLNSSRMTEAGSLDLIDSSGEYSDLEDRIDGSLPGSHRGGDMSTRSSRPEIKVTSVQFSPTANAFAAASTEGLLIYSIDETLIFDPFDLDIDITPQATLEVLAEKDYLTALVMAFRLNEEYLINKVYENVPVTQINSVCNQLPVVYVSRLLTFIGNFATTSQHIEFNLLWLKALLIAHGSFMKQHEHMFSSATRAVRRFIGRIAEDVTFLSATNKYAYRFLTSTSGKGADSSEEEIQNISDSSSSDEDDVVMQSDDDEDGEWIGFQEKKQQLALSEDDSESEDELLQ
ncbi:Periodic tryptophan protein 2 [Nakaseomyces glabratus]|uniref:Periodic tryptophan protein 2 n=1 Tax=Candida glabrata TaxID=5478 RepID=A0A0W0EIZ4_CANGB|nr:Trp-Asp (WD) repeats profile [Nakaseomyces glabratus]KAH7596330.1 Trp-Asp (WD) repeats profile [Nakaseomyces glabratus]KAH7611897.1 Trp-Asp (WD) repeats profile [Nakaseomyces glabratus]KTB02648.1 Periodic tryptophan protein 2 [Nakaseomyces glabratus]KTB07897.1 Periodic tryptophan protein 2 [Nakaseomyces glabratus]